ncbi:MAG: hypothetical protein RBG13Loki_3501 [Promethearchaeota archaeon CR_4]|nr:MAG: hypothetical protein RBG13Loki_3501 [Candidatus Lokiarchaeota archaeon CR_4]
MRVYQTIPRRGGFQNFETFCGAPGLCEKCNKIVLTNFLDPNAKCPDCGGRFKYYNDKSLQSASKTNEHVFTWNTKSGEFILPNTTYWCANYCKFSLKFENSAIGINSIAS